MPKRVIEPAGDHVIVADQSQETTLNGIELPGNVRQQDMLIGYVVYAGPLCSSHTKPQDIVMYGPYAGKMTALEGTEFRIMKEAQIEAYIRTVPDLEPTAE